MASFGIHCDVKLLLWCSSKKITRACYNATMNIFSSKSGNLNNGKNGNISLFHPMLPFSQEKLIRYNEEKFKSSNLYYNWVLKMATFGTKNVHIAMFILCLLLVVASHENYI